MAETASGIRGVHTMFYTSDAAATRAFLRDVLGFPHTDVGEGWLIFDLPEADMGCHPAAQPESSGDEDHGRPAGTHDISFYCDDLTGTMARLRERGVAFTQEVEDAGWGIVTRFKMPGGLDVQLYQPRYK